jgi:hypothetical protein
MSLLCNIIYTTSLSFNVIWYVIGGYGIGYVIGMSLLCNLIKPPVCHGMYSYVIGYVIGYVIAM